VLTRVLIYHNARNEKYVQYGASCECGNDLHRSVNRRVIHSNSGPAGCPILRDMTFSHRFWWRLRPVDRWRVTDVSAERNAFILDCWP